MTTTTTTAEVLPPGTLVDYHGTQSTMHTPLSDSWMIHSVCGCRYCGDATRAALARRAPQPPPRYVLCESDRPDHPELGHVRRESLTVVEPTGQVTP